MKYAIVLILAALRLHAESKAEADLRQRLERDETALNAAANERAQLRKQLSSVTTALNSHTATLGRMGSDSDQEFEDARKQRTGSDDDAQVNAEVARQTALMAADKAQSANQSAYQGNLTILVTQIVGFLTLIAGFIYKSYTDSRDRRWAQQDQARVNEVRAQQHGEVIAKLAGVKDEAHLAYTEANTVNNKIASIGVQMADGKPLNPNEPTKE